MNAKLHRLGYAAHFRQMGSAAKCQEKKVVESPGPGAYVAPSAFGQYVSKYA